MKESWFYILWTVGAYVLGSLPAGDLVARAAGVDIRSLGTRNPGTSNIYREVGRGHGVLVFVVDVAKGAAATVPLYLLSLPTWVAVVAMGALIAGHVFPIPWRRMGGTGLAAGMGTIVGLLPLGVALSAPATVVTVIVTRNPGYGGVAFFIVTAVAGGILHRDPAGAIAVLTAGAAILVRSKFQYRNL